ncbi:hypothetical protein [Photobacterium rosenbergii]|uniref:Uncharacterized protein n=1 Tax=Photobacterium rosenbergii TaxID=294936 RepID=A0ABU3ZM67_9GAMM|nr:hypothetical protein [Photobacterium rosenbergii]MDV5171141.1 hypothetical protein [Photobacterium rosenbergii]
MLILKKTKQKKEVKHEEEEKNCRLADGYGQRTNNHQEQEKYTVNKLTKNIKPITKVVMGLLQQVY